MDENIGNSGQAPAPFTSNTDDVSYGGSSTVPASDSEFEAMPEMFFDTPVQIKPFYKKNETDFLSIWCRGTEMPEIYEMIPLARITFAGAEDSTMILDTAYPEFSEILTNYVNKMPPPVVSRFKETETVVVACKTLTRELIYQAYVKKCAEPPLETETVKRPLIVRAERETQWLKTLSEGEMSALATTLEIIKKSDSVWLINTFKYACSVRGEELERAYRCAATSFEHKETTWYEIRWDKVLKKKVREAITSYLPTFMREWLTDLRTRRENLRKITENA